LQNRDKEDKLTGSQPLERLFRPSSVAVIGASNFTQKGGGFLLKGLLTNNFKGTMYPVNPRESEILGLRSYPKVTDIPGEVDLAIIAVSARFVPQVMSECSLKGIKFAVVHSVGFAELGTQGKALEQETLSIARRSGIRFVGPNCMGLCCPEIGLNTILPKTNLIGKSGGVAFLGQSGWVSQNFIGMGNERGLRFSEVVSVGNQADLSIEDFLEYLGTDTQTRVIGCYIEGIKHGKRFMQLVRQISPTKPIIVWKAGRTEAGVRAASSHTASLAGNSNIFDVALRQSGAIIARNLEELIDLAIGFTCPVLPNGNRLGVVVEAGGGGVATADTHESLGLEMPVLSEAAQKELADTLHGSVVALPNLRNPVDIVWPLNWPTGWATLKCLRIVLKEVDAALAIDYAHLNERLAKKIAALRDKAGKPVMIIPGDAIGQKQGMCQLVRNGVPSFTIPERALKVLADMVHYANNRHSSEPEQREFTRDEGHLTKQPIIDKARGEGRTELTEVESKKFLKQARISVIDTRFATSKEEAISISRKLGFPVALKIASPDIVHKSDAGGVKLGLRTANQVGKAYDDVMQTVSQKYPQARLHGVAVQKMARPGVEVIIGMSKDTQFGSVFMFGLGGIMVEVLKDISFRIGPLAKRDAAEMIREIQGYPLLEGYRGQEAVDLSYLEDMLLRISDFVGQNPEVKELDLNPIFAYSDGALVVDARIILEE
jgi:acyl-CoA synthetase (NDP forming)